LFELSFMEGNFFVFIVNNDFIIHFIEFDGLVYRRYDDPTFPYPPGEKTLTTIIMTKVTSVPEPNTPGTTDQKIDKVGDTVDNLSHTVDKMLALVINVHSDTQQLRADVASIRTTVDQHTTVLDSILKNTINWEAEMKVMRSRLERHENAFKIVAEKLNVDLSSLLH
jgi:hypothetical protein